MQCSRWPGRGISKARLVSTRGWRVRLLSLKYRAQTAIGRQWGWGAGVLRWVRAPPWGRAGLVLGLLSTAAARVHSPLEGERQVGGRPGWPAARHTALTRWLVGWGRALGCHVPYLSRFS